VRRQANIDWQAARASIEKTQLRLEHPEVPAEERRRIFRQRMEALAQAPSEPIDEGGRQQMIVFRVAEDRFALPLASVTEVLRGAVIVPAPGAPAIVAGVIPVRGEIRPVFDLRQLLTETAAEDQNSVLLVMHRHREVGLLVTRVEDICAVGEADLQLAPEGNPRIRGVTAGLIQVLDLDILLDESADTGSPGESLKLRDG